MENKQLMKTKLNFNYISQVIFRVLPNVRYNISHFNYLYKNKQIKSYFKNVRKLQEYRGLYDIFKEKGFDVSLVEQVRIESKQSKETFFKQINDYFSTSCKRSNFKYLCEISPKEITFLNENLHSLIFGPTVPIFHEPTLLDVIESINRKASGGLPNPFLKKGQLIGEILPYLESFYNQSLKSETIFQFPSAIFSRSQIRGSGLKLRVVHAVHYLQQALESFYFLYFKRSLPKDSSISLGLTQLEISNVVSKHKGYYTYSIDYKLWDRTRQPVLSVIAFSVIENYLPLSPYQSKIFRTLRSLYLTLPSFHPTIELARRWIGTVSGSGFTSLDNSICNLILTTLVLYRYYNQKGKRFVLSDFVINVSGDDLLLSSKYPLNFTEISSISQRDFGASMKLECEVSNPGKFDCYFLGSRWLDGKPFRSEKVLVAGVCFGTGNFPKLSLNELLQSRFFELFGNSADCYDQFKRLGVEPLNRLFYWNELARPFKDGTESSPRMLELEKVLTPEERKRDTRGFFYNVNMTSSVIKDLWATR